MAGLERASQHQPDVGAILAEVKRLQHQRPHRDRQKRFFVEGIRNCIQAIDRGLQIEALLYSKKLLAVTPARQRARQASALLHPAG